MKSYTLANSMTVPMLGFGTYNPGNEQDFEMILNAIQEGYRYFDTASLYGTERALGEAIKRGGIARDELILASKLWTDEMGYREAKEAFQRTIDRIGTEYLDFYLIHWPKQSEEDDGWKERCIATWKAMEELYEEGKVKGLGLSNFLPHHLDVILENAKVRPVLNQLELHPGYMQTEAVSYCTMNGILLQAWSPLGRGRLLSHPLLRVLSEKYAKTPAQICLRYLIQKNIAPIVKASGADRMKQNMDIFDFEISKEDMSVISCMPQEAWSGEHPDFAIPKVQSVLW